MIKLSDIAITKMAHKDGSLEYKAQLDLRVYHRVAEYTLAEVNVQDLESHIKEELIGRIWHEVYGDLKEHIFALIHEAKHMADPRYPITDLQMIIAKLEAKLK